MAHFEKRLSSETKFEGRVITVTLDRVELENGGTSTREVVRHHGGAGVAALNDEGEIYLVRQYRYALDRELIEIPAGKLEKEEDPLEAAGRGSGPCRRRIPGPGVYHSHLRILQRDHLPVCGQGPFSRGTAPGRGRISLGVHAAAGQGRGNGSLR
mgnify:CR=1 FL=1